MTDHPDPTALRLEGQRLVEAATPLPWKAQTPDQDGIFIIGLRLNEDGKPLATPTNGLVAGALPCPTEIDSQDFTRVAANAALIVFAVNNLSTLLTTLAALTEERDALIRDKEEAQSLLEWPFASVRELANETGRLRMNEHALTEERDRLRGVLREANAALVWSFQRIHTLPRASDTALADEIGKVRAKIEATLTARPTP